MSRPDYNVVVIGGGPAGSSSAIHLARGGQTVLLLEKRQMPRDKLCGEFLSTEVAEMCLGLGVYDAMDRAGARLVRRFRLTDAGGRVYEGRLPGTALSLSRRAFDHILFRRAAEAGADVADGESVVAIDGSLDSGFVIETKKRRLTAAVVLGAFGRRTALDRRLGRGFLSRRSPYVGFKARYEGPPPGADIELHAFGGGYCGLIVDEDELINVCWLAHADQLKAAGGSAQAMVDQILPRNPHLGPYLDNIDRVTPFMAVGQLAFKAKELFASDVCMVGDAAGMIAPLCGDGMGMALRTSELMSPFVRDFIDGRSTAAAFRAGYTRTWHREFSTRMQAGRLLHRALSRRSTCAAAVVMARLFPEAARRVIQITRG